MKTLIIIYSLLFLFVFSCKKKEQEKVDEIEVEKKVDTIINEQAKVNLSSQDSIEFNKPIKEFIDFVKLIEEDDWIHDVERLKVVGYGLDNKEPIYFNSKPFFQISFEETHLNGLYKIEKNFIHEVSPNFDFLLFKSTQKIWKYFYRNIVNDNWIEDGIIEQWSFNNEQDAKNALNQISNLGGRILYFNTQPYFTILRNHLFIFHTRAMAFSYNQKEVFQKFLLVNNIVNE